MAHLHHATYGWITIALSFTTAVLGSLLGLVCTVRARDSERAAARARWLVLSACAIGGTGIWAMHFMAMLGFTVSNTSIRFDVPLTIASAVMSVLVVGVGIFLAGYGTPTVPKILGGGLFTGIGVATMHYTGMAAMHVVDGAIQYDLRLVAASLAIAVVAATAALWFTVWVEHKYAIAGAAVVMGVAVSGMHFTGMAALRVQWVPGLNRGPGADVTEILLPSASFVGIALVGLLYAILATPEPDEVAMRAAPVSPGVGPAAPIEPSVAGRSRGGALVADVLTVGRSRRQAPVAGGARTGADEPAAGGRHGGSPASGGRRGPRRPATASGPAPLPRRTPTHLR